jgi:hypothetical protein
LDIDGGALLAASTLVPGLAEDFLCIAACIYAVDKAVARTLEDDKWTRSLAVEIPVSNLSTWEAVNQKLSECASFLTGDIWEINFRLAEKRLIQKKPRKRRVRYRRPSAKAICLFSGGLDSFIGALDWLELNPGEKLLLVGHYDRHVAGPSVDQRTIYNVCRPYYASRIQLVQTQVGLSSGGVDNNFRSRSLLFLALGTYFAEVVGGDCPVLIPENGPIALNFPLTPTRRGSCSTRTVHPHFIETINTILRTAGIPNLIINPFELLTKGEMVEGCRRQDILNAATASTRSCAKANHREHWSNKQARSCGICIPCLFRRASLYRSGRDTEFYGNRIEDIASLQDTPTDLLALIAFLRRQLSDREIASGLLANGTLPAQKLNDYVAVVKRMRGEVVTWLKAKGSPYIKNEVLAC